jgi:hypothetical protein
MTKYYFNAGDKVRLKLDKRLSQSLAQHIGRTFTVAYNIPTGSDFITLVEPTNLNDGWFASRFEKVEPTLVVEASATEFIVIAIDADGKYAPAETPRVYKSRSQAKAVAISMSKRHSGRFVVFQAVAEVEAVPTFRDLV